MCVCICVCMYGCMYLYIYLCMRKCVLVLVLDPSMEDTLAVVALETLRVRSTVITKPPPISKRATAYL